MNVEVTKKFHFSASFNHKKKIVGHNYTLGVTTGQLSESQELFVEKAVRDSLISRVDSRDLSYDVDFLKGVAINEFNLAEAFWSVLEQKLRPIALTGLSLAKDERSLITLSKDR